MSKTTFVVDFGGGTTAEPGVIVELEPSLNLDVEGKEKTNFAPGDEVYFTVHHPAHLRVASIATTSGDVHYIREDLFQRSQDGIFFISADDTKDLQHLPASGLEFFWFGRVGQLSMNGRSVTAVNAPCIGDVSYKILARLYRYVPPPEMLMNADDRYLSGVVITMEGA